MRRVVLLAPFVLVGLLFVLPGAAAVRTDDAKVTIEVVAGQYDGGQYRLYVENTGDGPIMSFTFAPASTLHVTSIASSTEGSCQLAGAGFSCSLNLNPPPCMCTPGDNVFVLFNGNGESSGSTVTIGSVTIPATGGGAIAAPATTPPTVSTPPPRSDPPRAKAKAKPKAPICKKGQKSTTKKPCRKR